MIPRQRPARAMSRAVAPRIPGPTRPDLAEWRDPALLLQQMIQPPNRTDADFAGLRVTARSRSAEPDVDIGGDWYLSAQVPGGDVFLAIGDSVGHGLQAAEAMMRLRFAMAAFAAEGHQPAAILAKLNTLLCWAADGVTATAVAARYSPHDNVLTWSSAGHLPLLLAGGQAVRQLPDPDGVILGVVPSARYGQCAVRLEPHDMVLMYTDGLIPRGQSLDEGVCAVADRLARAPRNPQAVLDRLDYRASRDDASALAVQRFR